MVSDALTCNPLLHDKDAPNAAIAALSGCTEAFGVTVATCAASVVRGRGQRLPRVLRLGPASMHHL